MTEKEIYILIYIFTVLIVYALGIIKGWTMKK